MDCKRIAIHEVIRDVGVELVGLDEPEVAALLRREPRQVVELETNQTDGIVAVLAGVVEPVVGVRLAVTTDGPHQLDDRMVEVQGQTHLASTSADLIRLHLRDKLLEGARGETIALIDVQVHVRRLDQGAQILLHQGSVVPRLQHDQRRGARDGAASVHRGLAARLDARRQLGEAHVQLDAVELQGHDRESVAAGLSEPERQRNVQTTIPSAVLHQVLEARLLANHLAQLLARLAAQLLPHVQVIRVHRVDHLTANHQGTTTNQPLADRVSVVSPRRAHVLGITAAVVLADARLASRQRRLVAARIAEVLLSQPGVPLLEQRLGQQRIACARIKRALSIQASIIASVDTRQVNHHVSPEQQITRTIESQLGVAPEHHLSIERLLNRFHSEICISIVSETPEGN